MGDKKVLVFEDVTKIYPGVVALDKVSVVFERGKVHCLMGENGAGKSTMAKILSGLRSVDGGKVYIDGKDITKDKKVFDKIAYVPQELDLFNNMSVAENLFMPFSKNEGKGIFVNSRRLEKKAIPYLRKFNITAKPSDFVGDISVSEQQLLQIARAMAVEASEIIMLDEPTTSLGAEDTQRLFKVINNLKEEDKAIIFVSHKIEEVFEIGDEITVLSNGVNVGHSKIEDITAKEVMKLMTGKDLDLDLNFYPDNILDEVVLEVENLYGERFRDVSFKLKKGEILGFAGLIGAGRSELLQTVYGYLPSSKGSVKLEGKKLKIGSVGSAIKNGIVYLPEERRSQGIFPILSVKDNITLPVLKQLLGEFTVNTNKETRAAKEVADDYNIKTPSLKQEIQYLSGGNQQKVIIGRSMQGQPKIIIFDEPTKGIDVGAKFEVYKIIKGLADQGVGIIMISSEIEELMRCANRIITLYHGKKAGEFETMKVDKSDVVHSMLGLENGIGVK